jgi:hypothetical protein
MKDKILKILTYFIFPFVFLIMVFSSVFNIFQKEKFQKERSSDAEEQPHIVENRYSDPFQGRNLVVKSITTSASVVSAFDDFLNREL